MCIWPVCIGDHKKKEIWWWGNSRKTAENVLWKSTNTWAPWKHTNRNAQAQCDHREHFQSALIQSKRAHTRYNLKCVFMGILCWFVGNVYIVVAVAVVVVSSACDCYNSNVVIAFCFVRFRSYFTLCRIDSFFSILCFLLLLRHKSCAAAVVATTTSITTSTIIPSYILYIYFCGVNSFLFYLHACLFHSTNATHV